MTLWAPWKLCTASPICLRLVALHPGGGLAHLLHGRQQQADQDGDDRDHHQQFDQREGASSREGAEHGGSSPSSGLKVGNGPFRGRAHCAGDGRSGFGYYSGVPGTRSEGMRDSGEALAADERVEDPAGAHGAGAVQDEVGTEHAIAAPERSFCR